MEVRLADRGDRARIVSLLTARRSTFLRVPIHDIDDVLASRFALVVTRDNHILGCILSIWPDAPTGWLDAIAIDPQADWTETFGALTQSFERYLWVKGVKMVYCSVEEGYDEPVKRGLLGQGYHESTRFIRHEKYDFVVPAFRAPRINVRPVTPDDIVRLAPVEEASFGPPWRDDVTRLKKAAERCPCFHVAEDRQGELVGFHYSDVKDDIGYFVHLAVSPAHRGANIAKALLSAAIGYFGTRGVDRIETRVEQRNRAARNLYTNFGFTPVGRPRTVLCKDLSQAARLPERAA